MYMKMRLINGRFRKADLGAVCTVAHKSTFANEHEIKPNKFARSKYDIHFSILYNFNSL